MICTQGSEVKNMKKMIMIFGLVLTLTASMTLSAGATMITGAISFSGTAAYNDSDLLAANQFAGITNAVVSGTGGEGDYSSVVAGTSVTVEPFTFRGPNATVIPFQLWSFSSRGNAFSFDVTSLSIFSNSRDTIALRGAGSAFITNFEDTPGTWNISANRAGGTASFSSSAEVTAVPEPATMFLLGSGLIGLAGYSSRRFKKQQRINTKSQ
jgi:hypothetical protein